MQPSASYVLRFYTMGLSATLYLRADLLAEGDPLSGRDAYSRLQCAALHQRCLSACACNTCLTTLQLQLLETSNGTW